MMSTWVILRIINLKIILKQATTIASGALPKAFITMQEYDYLSGKCTDATNRLRAVL